MDSVVVTTDDVPYRDRPAAVCVLTAFWIGAWIIAVVLLPSVRPTILEALFAVMAGAAGIKLSSRSTADTLYRTADLCRQVPRMKLWACFGARDRTANDRRWADILPVLAGIVLVILLQYLLKAAVPGPEVSWLRRHLTSDTDPIFHVVFSVGILYTLLVECGDAWYTLRWYRELPRAGRVAVDR